MEDYSMLYEKIVLASWGKLWKSEDPFGLGSADVLSMADNELTGQTGHNVKFGLSTALRKIAVENDKISEDLMVLDEQIWNAKVYNDICQIMIKTKAIFNSVGIVIF